MEVTKLGRNKQSSVLRKSLASLCTLVAIGSCAVWVQFSHPNNSEIDVFVQNSEPYRSADTEDFLYCQASSKVLSRRDGYGMEQLPGGWSVTMNDYLPYNTKQCENVKELTSAIKHGERVWVNASFQDAPDMLKAVETSYFRPAKCDIPYIQSQKQICSILGQYSSVVFLGDSLSRHLAQGLMVQMTDDYIAGGAVVQTNAARKHCKCDGLFSENAMCRGQDVIDLYDKFIEVCPDEQPLIRFDYWGASARKHPSAFVAFQAKRLVCPEDDERPLLIQLQGGLHVKSSANRTIKEIIQPLLNSPVFKECQEKGKIRFLWHAGSAQSRILDETYPWQAREKFLAFNEAIAKYFADNQVDITILDWWKLSENAQMSDGVHYLQDVNVMKSNHFLTAASMLR